MRAWVGAGGRARKLRDAAVTAGRHRVGAVVCVKAKAMKEALVPRRQRRGGDDA